MMRLRNTLHANFKIIFTNWTFLTSALSMIEFYVRSSYRLPVVNRILMIYIRVSVPFQLINQLFLQFKLVNVCFFIV